MRIKEEHLIVSSQTISCTCICMRTKMENKTKEVRAYTSTIKTIITDSKLAAQGKMYRDVQNSKPFATR